VNHQPIPLERLESPARHFRATLRQDDVHRRRPVAALRPDRPGHRRRQGSGR
jgi:hypothetical protein